MKKYLYLFLLVFMTAALLFAGGAKDASGASSENITLKFLIASGYYDLRQDQGYDVAQRVSGYKIDYEMLSGTEQLMLIISSGEPYDYVYLNNANYNLLMKEGALTDITDILKQHGSNITQAITTVWPATTVNGRIYAIPSTVAQPNALQQSIVYRKDLTDKAGISVGTTPDEFYNMLVKIKAAYPDKIPLAVGNDVGIGGYFVNNIASAFGLRGLWQEENGVVLPLVKHPGLKPYMEYMIKLYKAGLIDPEMPALKQSDSQNKWASGQAVVLYSGWNGIETPIGALKELEPQMKYDVLPLLKDARGNFTAEARSGVGAYAGVPITSKYPVDTIKAINNQIELKNFTEIALGIEGVHYTLKDGVYYPIQPAFNKDDAPIHKAVLYGIHGGHVNCTDGTYVYMRASSGRENAPLYNYTLMPMHMRERFSLQELRSAELSKPFSFTKGCGVLKIPSYGIPELNFSSYDFGTMLFDLENDPGQEHPIQDAALEERMAGLLMELMEENDAPDEQYIRLGLNRRGIKS
ncbi:extracellular solute-binding protein [Treponema sp. OttesenSCG-928-L16]|nr:extracellular solute-binding protein [Treponema sp. OttesenSCG-928-L16]